MTICCPLLITIHLKQSVTVKSLPLVTVTARLQHATLHRYPYEILSQKLQTSNDKEDIDNNNSDSIRRDNRNTTDANSRMDAFNIKRNPPLSAMPATAETMSTATHLFSRKKTPKTQKSPIFGSLDLNQPDSCWNIGSAIVEVQLYICPI